MAPKPYKYTYDNSYLTEQQRDFYEDNGYIVIPKLVAPGLLDECNQRFLDVCQRKVSKGMIILMKDVSLRNKNVEGEYVINKIQEISRDEVFFKYTSYQPMIDIVQSIIGPNITSIHSMLVNKPPNSDIDASKHPLHQDYYYFPFDMVDSIVASWTAMEKIDEANGCLFVIPGSHKGILHKHINPPNVKNVAYHEASAFYRTPVVKLIMEKGDTVFFHPLLLHGSGPNLTKGFRRAISCHYVDSNARPLDVKGTDREKMAQEVLNAIKKLGYTDMKFEDIWKIKSLPIRGSAGYLQQFASHL